MAASCGGGEVVRGEVPDLTQEMAVVGKSLASDSDVPAEVGRVPGWSSRLTRVIQEQGRA